MFVGRAFREAPSLHLATESSLIIHQGKSNAYRERRNQYRRGRIQYAQRRLQILSPFRAQLLSGELSENGLNPMPWERVVDGCV